MGIRRLRASEEQAGNCSQTCRGGVDDRRGPVPSVGKFLQTSEEPDANQFHDSHARRDKPARRAAGRHKPARRSPGDAGRPDARVLIVTLPEVGPRRVLVVGAHPDDVEFGAAGTVARWTNEGVEVSYCVVTDGAAGSADPSLSMGELRGIREAEQRDAAAQVGVSEVVFLGYRDGELEVGMALRRDLVRVIRSVKPNLVVAQSPERNWDRIRASHPDHLAAGEAVLCAVYPDARNRFAHPELLDEGLEPHTVPAVWLMASPRADRAVDVTATFDQKLAALLAHRSQVGDPARLEEMLRSWTGDVAAAFGLEPGSLAESFQVVVTE